jgi:hypothetical protein
MLVHYGRFTPDVPVWRYVLAALLPWWTTHRRTGVWRYEQRAIDGTRRVVRVGLGHQPVDYAWLIYDTPEDHAIAAMAD